MLVSRTSLLIASTLLLAACGDKPPPRRPGQEYLSSIEIEGNTKLGDKTLTSGLALKRNQARGRPPDPYLIQVDADRIRGEYLRSGFLSIDVRSRVERKGDAAKVVYSVDEGMRATTRVVITGLPPDVPVARVREALPLADGAPFDYEVYDLAKPMLMGVVEDSGYAYAELEATVFADRIAGEAVVQLAYNPGPKCVFGTVEITGVDGKLEEAVRDRLQFAAGDTYSTRSIAATQRQLYGLARFSTVQVQPAEEASPVVNVTVAVSQAARHEVKLGGGFGIDPTAYEVRGRAGYTIAGWPTQMDTFTLDLRPAYAYLRDGSGFQPRIRAIATIERQDIFWAYSKGEIQGGYNYLAIEAYTSYGPLANVGFSTPLGTQRVHLRLAAGIESLDFRNISPVIDEALQTELGITDTQRNGTYRQALTLDLRDNPMTTTRGLYGALAVTEGTKYAGGEFEYLQLVPEIRGYVPVGRVVLAARGRAGTFFGEVPATERFFSGGGTNHRGFGERRLSPSVTGEVEGDTITVPYGGTTMLETGFEARIPLTSWRKIGIGVVTFLDGGDVTEERSQLDLGNLHWAIGAGLRLLTIVGPIRFDLGYRLNRTGPMDPAPGSRFAFHFSIGEAF
ncbi:MAG: BamA/TamA family outer membrane protein [Deltaproteobacteria bacterium]|nr:BamA/TamA family outer membrane protein [Deltaproteobacteria bacterium]